MSHEFLKCSRPAQARHSVDSGEDPVWRCFGPSIEAGEIADIKHIDSSETSEESGELMKTKDESDEDEQEHDKDPTIECTLAHFVEGSDIARRSFKCRHVVRSRSPSDVPLPPPPTDLDDDDDLLPPCPTIGNLSDEIDSYLQVGRAASSHPLPGRIRLAGASALRDAFENSTRGCSFSVLHMELS